MSAQVEEQMAAVAAGVSQNKRKAEDLVSEEPSKLLKTDLPLTSPLPTSTPEPASGDKSISKAREIRLEQNRKAARESRRRKKVMIEELQRSVIFFSRSNSVLKSQNDNLTRLLIQAQAQIAAKETGVKKDGEVETAAAVAPAENSADQAQAQAVATQAIFESQGFPAAAARAAAQTMSGSSEPAAAAATTAPNTTAPMPPMQPGATMQAMANFQQAAAAAMQNAMQGMSNIPGLNMSALAATPVGVTPQQSYQDTMTALAMQQAAAAAAAGQQYALQQQQHAWATPDGAGEAQPESTTV